MYLEDGVWKLESNDFPIKAVTTEGVEDVYISGKFTEDGETDLFVNLKDHVLEGEFIAFLNDEELINFSYDVGDPYYDEIDTHIGVHEIRCIDEVEVDVFVKTRDIRKLF